MHHVIMTRVVNFIGMCQGWFIIWPGKTWQILQLE